MSENNPYTKSDFKESQDSKKERFEELSQKNTKRSNDLHQESRAATEHIPFGQPILVGHHSERKHRNAIDKSWKKLGKAVEASNKADHYESKAKTVGTGGIASDDPEAIIKLKNKLSNLENGQKIMKQVNKEFRSGGWDAVVSISQKQISKLKSQMERISYQHQPFPGYSLSNNSAEIRRIKKRIKQLDNLRSQEPIQYENSEFELGISEGRIYFIFHQGKPSEECRKFLKSNAFRWSRYSSQWQRKVTNNAMYSTKSLLKSLLEMKTCY